MEAAVINYFIPGIQEGSTEVIAGKTKQPFGLLTHVFRLEKPIGFGMFILPYLQLSGVSCGLFLTFQLWVWRFVLIEPTPQHID